MSPPTLAVTDLTVDYGPVRALREVSLLVPETIRAINAEGIAVLLIEQNAALALELASYACVLEVGAVALEGSAMEKIAGEYQMAYKGQPLDSAVYSGHSTAAIVGEALKKARANKDLTRDGITNAHRGNAAFQIGTSGPPMDFTQFNRPAPATSSSPTRRRSAAPPWSRRPRSRSRPRATTRRRADPQPPTATTRLIHTD